MRVDFDEERQWIVMERGALAITANLGTDAVDVPVTGDVVLAWEDPVVGAQSTTLAGRTFAILRRSQSR